jgi:hypothetical protein
MAELPDDMADMMLEGDFKKLPPRDQSEIQKGSSVLASGAAARVAHSKSVRSNALYFDTLGGG